MLQTYNCIFEIGTGYFNINWIVLILYNAKLENIQGLLSYILLEPDITTTTTSTTTSRSTPPVTSEPTTTTPSTPITTSTSVITTTVPQTTTKATTLPPTTTTVPTTTTTISKCIDIAYTYFMFTLGKATLLSWGSGENLENCCSRPKAKGNNIQDLLHYRGIMVWLYPT